MRNFILGKSNQSSQRVYCQLAGLGVVVYLGGSESKRTSGILIKEIRGFLQSESIRCDR